MEEVDASEGSYEGAGGLVCCSEQSEVCAEDVERSDMGVEAGPLCSRTG